MLALIKPERDELDYRAKLLTRPHNFDFGEEPQTFSEEDWDSFTKTWLSDDAKHIYRYGYCEECGFSIGAASLCSTSSDAYQLRILIYYNMRKCGFGASLLDQMLELAKKNGASRVYLTLTPETPYLPFFTKRGFEHEAADTYCRIL